MPAPGKVLLMAARFQICCADFYPLSGMLARLD